VVFASRVILPMRSVLNTETGHGKMGGVKPQVLPNLWLVIITRERSAAHWEEMDGEARQADLFSEAPARAADLASRGDSVSLCKKQQ